MVRAAGGGAGQDGGDPVRGGERAVDVERFMAQLRASGFYQGQVVYERTLPASEGRPGPAPAGAGGLAAEVCAALGIERLHAHQAAELTAVRGGRDVVLAGGSASGKSLSFLIAAVEGALAEPPSSTLILCPNKPVAVAQRRKLEAVAGRLPRLAEMVTRYDGDLSASRRRAERRRSIVITNPDMLHAGILPNHPRWAAWFSRLRLVVVEELHAYSGLFGSNVAGVFRRLWRICAHYGGRPQLVCTSSTSSNPAEHARLLTGREVEVLRADDAPRGPKRFVFWRPGVAVPSVEAGRLMAELLGAGAGCIAFSRARVAAELIAEYARRELRARGLPEAGVLSYRGGLRPEEAADLEASAHSGRPVAISATNLLELGLDVPALDAALICGWPGALSSFFQQAGRVGRAGQPSLVFYVGLHDPINAFLMAHPDYIFERPVEPGVVERTNPHVLAGQLRCAVQELPLREREAEEFGPGAREVLGVLTDRRKLYEKDGVWYSIVGERAARELPLRGPMDQNVLLHDASTGKVVAEVDWLGAHSVVHPRAIYLHEGRQYLVKDFKRQERNAYAEPVRVDYYTNPLGRCYVHSVDACLRERPLAGGTAFFGEVTCGCVTTGYEERRYVTNELIRSVPLELPPVLYETMGLWLCLSEQREAELTALGLAPEYYGLGNAMRIVLPLFMTCDVLDLRPWPGLTNFTWRSLYFYERYPRGLGYTERVFGALDEVMEAAARNVQDCVCADGCPLCVGDPPRPFMVNNPELEGDLIPSRRAVRLLLGALRERAPVEDLICCIYGAAEGRAMLSGRSDLLEQRRAEAAGAPARRLPADAPAESARPSEPETRLPLQLAAASSA
jgi:DEAD/DEAH box helicase domain-containing protein